LTILAEEKRKKNNTMGHITAIFMRLSNRDGPEMCGQMDHACMAGKFGEVHGCFTQQLVESYSCAVAGCWCMQVVIGPKSVARLVHG